MALIFYLTINVIATNLIVNNPIDGIDANTISVYEVLLLWSNKYIGATLALLFTLLALFNVPFSCFIGFE